MKGLLMIVSGPSGVGKDTLIDKWTQRDPTVKRVVAYTTRERRKGELDGRDYHFVSEAKFKSIEERGGFLESKFVHGEWYGTPREDMESMLRSGLTAILKIDVQGALTVLETRSDAVSVFILPPSMEVLEARLRSRRTESEAKIQARLETAKREIGMAGSYRYRVVNDEIDAAVAELAKIREDHCQGSC